MLNLAATVTPPAVTQSDDIPHDATGVAVLVLALVVLAAGYLLTCWIWPFGRCRRCHGRGKRRAPIGRVYRHCAPCDGSGYRLRAGRHVVNRLRATRRAGTKPSSGKR